MTVLSDDNIVARALLNVLLPSAEQRNVCALGKHVALNRCRVASGKPATEPCPRPVQRPAQIVVTECLSPTTISVSWSDPCSGRYAEQVWCRGLARVASICALTGRHIGRGDNVYRPRTRNLRVPSNRNQIILAGAIEFPIDLPNNQLLAVTASRS
ncbi:DUF3331 domain-containing protein [Paraburkholderia strydomiana]|uniref:DUF3331 domain-containing protein n=1 Tax=Paraburkholderia strydomiana TaxID=1245417 RepID=UPI0038BA7666